MLWSGMLGSMSDLSTERTGDRGPVRRVVLTGFMGSGKSTVGPLVAERLGWRFLDTDDVVVAEIGMAISDFFAQHGEPVFRDLERKTIAQLLAGDTLVLALGGGAIEDAATRDLLLNEPGTILVNLDVPLETTLTRCPGTDQTRPVLADRANLSARYERRLPLYRGAHVSIAADLLTPGQIADIVVRAVGVPGLV